MIGGEIAYSFILGDLKKVYRVNDTINSLFLGTLQELFGALTAPYIKAQYTALFNKYRIFNIPDTMASSIGVIILADFLYYWAHRFGHKFNFMWAAHSIHHSSENFNYSTALRQASFQQGTALWIQSLPAAILGIPYDVFRFHSNVNTVMQFWIHTQYFKSFGPLEYIFNTPAQHIIHHSRSPGECNKNFAGWFSIWDQLFGTFELGHRPKKFGVIEQHYTWDPIVINLKNYYLLFKRMMRFEGVTGKIQWLFSSARFVTDGGINDENLAKPIRFNTIMTNNQSVYCMMMLAVTSFEYLYQVLNVNKRGYKAQVISSLYLTLSMSSLCQFMNKSKIARLTETLRWSMIVGLIAGSKYIGIDKLSTVFDDEKSNIAKFLASNIGTVIGKMEQNRNKSILGIGMTGIAVLSLKYAIFDKDDEENDDKDK